MKEMTAPLTEILLSTFQGERYLEELLDSLLHQTCQDFCLYIRDDGSTDRTREILSKKIPEFHTGQVKLLGDHQHLGSAAASFLCLLRECRKGRQPEGRASSVMFCDQDDIWEPEKVAVSRRAIRRMEQTYGEKTPLLYHSDLSVITEDGHCIAPSFLKMQHLSRNDSLNHLLVENTVTGCAMTLNGSAADLLVRADVSEMRMHDHYAAVLVAATGRVYSGQKPLVRYRQHGQNAVGATYRNREAEWLRRLKEGKTAFRQEMEQNYHQAGDILKRYEPEIRRAGGEERLCMMAEFSRLSSASPFLRRKVFRKYHLYKNEWIKREVQKIWC